LQATDRNLGFMFVQLPTAVAAAATLSVVLDAAAAAALMAGLSFTPGGVRLVTCTKIPAVINRCFYCKIT
jgi:hypothetical protein